VCDPTVTMICIVETQNGILEWECEGDTGVCVSEYLKFFRRLHALHRHDVGLQLEGDAERGFFADLETSPAILLLGGIRRVGGRAVSVCVLKRVVSPVSRRARGGKLGCRLLGAWRRGSMMRQTRQGERETSWKHRRSSSSTRDMGAPGELDRSDRG
jgi:hypothetical protein